jgi:hypothetical protein
MEDGKELAELQQSRDFAIASWSAAVFCRFSMKRHYPTQRDTATCAFFQDTEPSQKKFFFLALKYECPSADLLSLNPQQSTLNHFKMSKNNPSSFRREKQNSFPYLCLSDNTWHARLPM